MNVNAKVERNQDATVYVGNLASEVEEDLLYELMVQVGPVVHVKLPKDKISKQHQGFSFVEFKTPRDAEYAIKVMNGVALYGRNLRINKANRNETAQTAVDVGANLYVGNLDPLVDESFLAQTFNHFGKFVRPPVVVRDAVTNESKGHGFLYFDSFETADKVLAQMNNQYLMNRQIKIDYAMKKDGKHGERHGDEVERLLAKNAAMNNLISAQPVEAVPAAGAQDVQQQDVQSSSSSGGKYGYNRRGNNRGGAPRGRQH